MIYEADIVPAQSYEAIETVASRLRLDSPLEGGLGGAGRIYAHRVPHDKADRYLVVREPVIPGGRPEGFTRVDALPIQIMAECHEGHPNPDWWLSAIHARVYEVLTGLRLALDHGETLLPLVRRSRPSGAAYDADDHAYYSSAEYRTSLGPTPKTT